MLSNILVCYKKRDTGFYVSCNQSMYGVPNRKKKPDGTYYKISYAYKCRQTRNTNGVPCSCAKQYNCKELDEEFINAIRLCLFTPEIIDGVMEKINKEFDMSELENKLKDLTARQRELLLIQKKYEQAQRSIDINDKHYDRKFENYSRQLEEIYPIFAGEYQGTDRSNHYDWQQYRCPR